MNERMVTIIFIGLMALLSLAGAIALYRDDPTSAGALGLTGLAGTALGLLAPSPLSKTTTAADLNGPAPVRVTNDPLPVTETPADRKD